MKKLEISQMENLQGSTNPRNCMLLGGLIAGSAIAGFFTAGSAWAITAVGVAAAAMQGDCF